MYWHTEMPITIMLPTNVIFLAECSSSGPTPPDCKFHEGMDHSCPILHDIPRAWTDAYHTVATSLNFVEWLNEEMSKKKKKYTKYLYVYLKVRSKYNKLLTGLFFEEQNFRRKVNFCLHFLFLYYLKYLIREWQNMFPCQDYKDFNDPMKNVYGYGQKLEKNMQTKVVIFR